MNRFAPSLTDVQFQALPLAERFVLVAAHMSDVAKVQEYASHNNHGPEIDAWCKVLKQGNGGIPWCGIFVSICLRLAGYWGRIPSNPASTHSWASWAKQTGRALPAGSKPRRGDIFVLLFTPTTGHMGVCLQDKDGDGLTDTIEGNSNDDGSRDGYKVTRHDRKLVAGPKTVIMRITE